jgi:DNA-binding transcriptional LysR family regulator
MATISLDLVAPFLCVAERGSFSAAAAMLGVEKSSVSRAVARLEDAVGGRLFHRTTRRVSLTDLGSSVRARLRAPYDSLDAAMQEAASLSSAPRGRIALTCPGDFGAMLLTEALARFSLQHPLVEVQVRLSGRFLDLIEEGLDAAIRISQLPLRDSSLNARKIGSLPVRIYAAPSYAETYGLPRHPREARAHHWIGFPATNQLRMNGPGGAFHLRVEGRVSCDEMIFAHHAILQGIGIGVLPPFLAEADARAGRLVQLFPKWSIPGAGHVWFVTPGGRHKPSPIVQKLGDLLVEVLAARDMGPVR